MVLWGAPRPLAPHADVGGSSASRLQYIHDQAGPCPGPGRPLVLIPVTGLGRSCSQMRQYRAGIGGCPVPGGAWGSVRMPSGRGPALRIGLAIRIRMAQKTHGAPLCSQHPAKPQRPGLSGSGSGLAHHAVHGSGQCQSRWHSSRGPGTTCTQGDDRHADIYSRKLQIGLG